jgi:hypothetical protein
VDPLKRVAAGVLAVLCLSACSAPPPPEKSAVVFRSESGVTSASWGKTPHGTRLEACPLYAGKRELTIVLAVPNRFRLQDARGTGCSFGTTNGFESIGVSGDAESTLHRRMEKDLKPYEDIGGDDSVSDISYEANVPAFGERRGEHLEHRCFCDGQDLQNESFRAGGVVLGTSIPHEPKPMPKSALTIVRPTVSVERGLFGLVTAHGTAVRYGIPPHPDYVSGLADGMQFGFRKPDYRRIELHGGVGALTEERNRLATDASVSGLALADAPRAVAGRDGQRLTYDQRFQDYDNSTRVEHVVAFQAGAVRVAVINEQAGDLQQEFRDRIREIR